MIYNGTNGDSFQEDITFLTSADEEAYPIKDRNRYINEAYSKVAFLIIKAEGRMQWDDANHTDVPKSSCDLVTNQASYNIFSAAPTALKDWLSLERLEILDPSGNGIVLHPIDHKDIPGPLSEFMKEPGIPQYFDLNGTQVTLYPKPNYNCTGGMTAFFNRAPSYFAITDTTKRPGFATLFHPYLSKYASFIWNSTKKGDYSLQAILTGIEADIKSHYGNRNKKIEVPRLIPRSKKLIR
jgi:hypothetical protein